MRRESPFLALPWVEFDQHELLKTVSSIPEHRWRGQGVDEYFLDHTQGPRNIVPADSWNMNTALGSDWDYTQDPQIHSLRTQFTLAGRCLFYTINWKRTRRGYQSPRRPMMTYPEAELPLGIQRTFDVIVPIQGDFGQTPLVAIDPESGTEYTCFRTRGRACAVAMPTTPDWHYTWNEGVYDYRYALHLRFRQPVTMGVLEHLAHG